MPRSTYYRWKKRYDLYGLAGLESISKKPNNLRKPTWTKKTERTPGCQIDYMIQANNGVLYVCEIKFSKNPVGKEVISQMQQKLLRLKYPKGFSIRPVLIHVNGISDELKKTEFFVKTIDFGRILSSETPDKKSSHRLYQSAGTL